MSQALTRCLEHIVREFPSAANWDNLSEKLRHVVSDIRLQLPSTVYTRVEKAVRDIYAFSRSKEYFNSIHSKSLPNERELLDAPCDYDSVFMAYDFHYDQEKDQLSLIEINTNGGLYSLSSLMYKTLDIPPPKALGARLDPLLALRADILSYGLSSPRIAIVDEDPSEQKMYYEFLIYQDLFRSWGWECEIQDIQHFDPGKWDLVYNRLIDFTFTWEKSEVLRNAFLKGQPFLAPHPKDYLLLAHKERLIDFFKAHVSEVIPPTYDIGASPDLDKIWSERKKLFFKPKMSYGSKGVYKGSSISRTTFTNNINEHYIAQEYRPAGTLDDWKYDLRFFTFKDQIRLVVARVFKGQAMNFSELGGGLAPVTFI